jgi:thiamine biosynthesis lipoprotein
MGTFVAIEARHAYEFRVAEAIAAAYEEFSAIERLLHPDRVGSDLAAIRDAPIAAATRVQPLILQMLRLAREVWEQSGRVFDPCLPDAPGTMADLILDDQHVTASQRVHIDLGGIAKGYAIDVAIETLISHGCVAGSVNAGGDVRVFGSAPVDVIVKCGGQEQRRALTNSAIAVSDTRAPSAPSEHRGYYRRGASTDLVARGAIVYANRAAVADALTKCLLLCDPLTSDRLLRAFEASGEVVAVSD